MIYFLVNNDYQLVDARRHLQELQDLGWVAALIEVPHALSAPERGKGFASVREIASPLTSHGWLKSWPRYFASAREVKRSLNPVAGDTLFFYTEFELINQMIARRFKRSGARVVLLEDGGFGTYLPFSIAETEPMGAKERLIAAMTRLLPGLGRTVFHKVNDQVFPWLPDDMIDAVGMYRDVRIVRRIPTQLMRAEARPGIEPTSGKVIFLNERMYDVYQTRDQYMCSVEHILQGLCGGFEQVAFKFHPREQDEWMRPIRSLIAERFPSVRIIEDRSNMESLLASERPEVLASYFSTTLLNLEGSGVEPLYLYHLFDELAQQKIFRQTTALLSQWNYAFVDSMDDARTGYRSNLQWHAGRAPTGIAEFCASSPGP